MKSMKNWPTGIFVIGYCLLALGAILLAWGISIYCHSSFWYALLLECSGPLIIFGVFIVYADSESRGMQVAILAVACGVWLTNGHFEYSKGVTNYIFVGLPIGGCILAIGAFFLLGGQDEKEKVKKEREHREAQEKVKAERLAQLRLMYGPDMKLEIQKNVVDAIGSLLGMERSEIKHVDQMRFRFESIKLTVTDFIIAADEFDNELVLLATALCEKIDVLLSNFKMRNLDQKNTVLALEMTKAFNKRIQN